MKKIKRYFKILFLTTISALVSGCSGYLDMVPDNVATMAHAFSNRAATERFLFGCYNYLPNASGWNYPPRLGGDELWPNVDESGWYNRTGAMLGKGFQNANDPYLNFWDGTRDGKNLFIGIRDCNIFLENIHIPTDIEDYERNQWIAEIKFLKAYFHAFLLELYGPIPIIRTNLPVNATSEEVRVFREPVDEVVDYIVELLDEAIPDLLPETFSTAFTDAGRITRPIAAAVKAKVLALAASPLFNGKEHEAPTFSLVDKRGVQLFSQEYKAEKWERALKAIKEAVEISHAGGHRLYIYIPNSYATSISDVTRLKYTLRGAVTDLFNSEVIWSFPNDAGDLQRYSIPNLGTYASIDICNAGPTMKIAEQYYTRNGIPTEEDAEWLQWAGGSIENRYEYIRAVSTAGSGIDHVSSLAQDHQYYIRGSQDRDYTAKMHFYREPRFYAHLGFDRGIWEGQGRTEANNYVVEARGGESQGVMGSGRHVTCGYFSKKLVHLETVKEGSTYSGKRYPFPLIRLTDLYLLYAEALNETKTRPDLEVYQWIDSVRLHAGLNGVVESWAKATDPSKVTRKDDMREIIKRERMIELALEGQRYWDLRRWKDAMRYFSEPVQGWAFRESTAEEFYKVSNYYYRTFSNRDYFWPLKLSTIQVNSNLKQNPGW